MTATTSPARTNRRAAAAAAHAHVDAPVAPQRGAKRPPLAVVRPEERAALVLRRNRAIALATALFATIAVFALITFHVVLTQNQFRLEQMERRAAQEQAQFDRLRLEVAQLESPDRIVAAAHELGMVAPPEVHYLTPVEPEKPASGDDAAAEDETTGWTAIKPHLAAQP